MKEILTHAAIRMNCENIMPTGNKAVHKMTNTLSFHLYGVFKFINTENKPVTGSGRNRKLFFNGHSVSVI